MAPHHGKPTDMLTKLTLRNFKLFPEAEIELGPVTVLCGPNNSGKTTALQAIALWHAGLRAWQAGRGATSRARQRVGVQINRRDLVAIPVPATNLLWNRLHTRDSRRNGTRSETQNVRIDIVLGGTGPDGAWECGLEFDYPDQEAVYCRPLRLSDQRDPGRMDIPAAALATRIALLPAMSGLASSEPKWEPGRIDVLISEGQTAQVLRNLCFRLHEEQPDRWRDFVGHVRSLFGVMLHPPLNVAARGEITMGYRQDSIDLDLSAAGRGQQQIMLLLAYVLANPGATLLLDEPDAHLEILRQRQTYSLLAEIARGSGSQIIAASHSEVVLTEAAGKDTLVAFVGRPHRIDDRGVELRKWLAEYPIDHLYQAEQQGWVLYLEGSTDLAVLQAFAARLGHAASKALERPFVVYVANDPTKAQRHFAALREAKPDIRGIALFDRLDRVPGAVVPEMMMWSRREIENYFARQDVLEAWARADGPAGAEADLFAASRVTAMRDAIEAIVHLLRELDDTDAWSADVKASDQLLDRVFRRYFAGIGQGMRFRKADYHGLVGFMPPGDIDPEVTEKLDRIATVAGAAANVSGA